MSITLADIQAERHEIKIKMDRLIQRDKALDALEATYGKMGLNVLIPNDYSVKVKTFGDGASHIPKRKTLADSIREAIAHLDNKQFTVGDIESELKKMGRKMGSKSPRIRISMSLNKMVKNREIRQTYMGAGSVPHQYQAIKKTMLNNA